MADLQKLRRSDFEHAQAVLARAFLNYNLMVYAQPDRRRRASGVLVLYGAILWDCLCRGEVYATTEFTGIAAWLPPGTQIPNFMQQVRAGNLRLPLRFGIRGFARLLAYDKLARSMHHRYTPRPHWFLAAVGVDVQHQGRGIGGSLIQPMLDRADADRRDCWLDTHEEKNVRLYQRLGFNIAQCSPPSGHTVPVYGMLRPAR